MKVTVSNNINDKAEYDSINKALDVVKDFDEIHIKNGNYNEFFTISKNIKITADDNVNISFDNDLHLDNLIFINETCQLNNLNIFSNNTIPIHIFSCFDVILNNCYIESRKEAILVIGSGDFIISNCKIFSKYFCIQYNNFFENYGFIKDSKLKSDETNILLSKNAILKIEKSDLFTSNKHNIILRDESQIFLNNTNLESKESNIKLREYALKKNVILQNSIADIS